MFTFTGSEYKQTKPFNTQWCIIYCENKWELFILSVFMFAMNKASCENNKNVCLSMKFLFITKICVEKCDLD